METDERTSSIEPAGILATACTHRRPDRAVVAELMATRYALLNLFHATALAGAGGKQLLPDSVLKIRDQADAQKRQKARKLLRDFFAQAEHPGRRKA
jgi:hypothetical protein